MGPFSLSLAIGALNGFALAALLTFSARNRPANRILALLIALLSWRAGAYILGYAGAYDAHRWLTFFPFDLSLSYGPLLWLYVHRLTTNELPAHWQRHFIPVAVQLLYLVVCFALPLDAKWEWYTGLHLHAVAPAGAAAALTSALYYLYRSYRLARGYQTWLDGAFANRDEARLNDLGYLLASFAIALLVSLAFAMTSWLIRPLDYFDRFPLMVVFALLTYALGILGWRNGAVSFPVWKTGEASPAPEAACDASDDAAPIEQIDTRREAGARLKAKVAASEWWRDEDLDLEKLARLLGMSSRTLSRTLGEGLDTNFREFIGRMRVDAVAAALTDGDGETAILDAAMAAGFKSKASFNRAFKAYRGVTPSAFRADALEKKRLKNRQSPPEASVEAT